MLACTNISVNLAVILAFLDQKGVHSTFVRDTRLTEHVENFRKVLEKYMYNMKLNAQSVEVKRALLAI